MAFGDILLMSDLVVRGKYQCQYVVVYFDESTFISCDRLTKI